MSGIAGNQQLMINFTRSNEYEADRVGIGILTDTGINPEGMVEFFEILLDKSPDRRDRVPAHPSIQQQSSLRSKKSSREENERPTKRQSGFSIHQSTP